MKYIDPFDPEDGEDEEDDIDEQEVPITDWRKLPVVELTRRNLEVLLMKLDDPLSARTLVDRDNRIAVRAVENVAHYHDRLAGPMFMPSTGLIL